MMKILLGVLAVVGGVFALACVLIIGAVIWVVSMQWWD